MQSAQVSDVAFRERGNDARNHVQVGNESKEQRRAPDVENAPSAPTYG
jgi:hypothetical protein